VLNGLAYDTELYPPDGTRQFTDIDLLIASDGLETARRTGRARLLGTDGHLTRTNQLPSAGSTDGGLRSRTEDGPGRGQHEGRLGRASDPLLHPVAGRPVLLPQVQVPNSSSAPPSASVGRKS
jgi:hypothetical protein